MKTGWSGNCVAAAAVLTTGPGAPMGVSTAMAFSLAFYPLTQTTSPLARSRGGGSFLPIWWILTEYRLYNSLLFFLDTVADI
jgi:hypothetical protein